MTKFKQKLIDLHKSKFISDAVKIIEDAEICLDLNLISYDTYKVIVRDAENLLDR